MTAVYCSLSGRVAGQLVRRWLLVSSYSEPHNLHRLSGWSLKGGWSHRAPVAPTSHRTYRVILRDDLSRSGCLLVEFIHSRSSLCFTRRRCADAASSASTWSRFMIFFVCFEGGLLVALLSSCCETDVLFCTLCISFSSCSYVWNMRPFACQISWSYIFFNWVSSGRWCRVLNYIVNGFQFHLGLSKQARDSKQTTCPNKAKDYMLSSRSTQGQKVTLSFVTFIHSHNFKRLWLSNGVVWLDQCDELHPSKFFRKVEHGKRMGEKGQVTRDAIYEKVN